MTGELTPKKGWQGIFIKRLCETGNVSASSRKAKITRAWAYETRDNDAAFAAAWDEALEIATENLEMEARRRAEKGVPEYVIVNSKRVMVSRKYSDTLLIFLLKAHKPEKYRDNSHVEHSGSVELVPKGYVGISPDEWDKDKTDSNL